MAAVPIETASAPSASAFAASTPFRMPPETTRLTTSHLPVHSHAVRASRDGATTTDPSNAVPAAGVSYAVTPNATMSPAMIGNSGGGSAHENRQPYLGLNYIIALHGAFPSP